MTTDPIILGPTDTARLELQIDFARSSADWRLRAADAALRGDLEHAQTCNRIAEIAATVSRGGEP